MKILFTVKDLKQIKKFIPKIDHISSKLQRSIKTQDMPLQTTYFVQYSTLFQYVLRL